MAAPVKNLIAATKLSTKYATIVPIGYSQYLPVAKVGLISYNPVLTLRSWSFKVYYTVGTQIAKSNPVKLKNGKAVSYTVLTFPPVYKVYGSGSTRPSLGLIYPRGVRS